MSNSKKIISLLLSVIMIMSVFNIVPFTASAAEAEAAETGAESGTTGDCTWTLDNGVLTISGNGEMEDYDSFWENDDPVTTAPWGGYSFNTVVIESGVTSIGDYAFYRCSGLTSVTIPDSVTSIGSSAFSGTGLTSIDIPDSVTWIGLWAFEGCTGLTSIKVAEGNTVYDSRDNCNALIETESNELIYGCKNTVIPDSVTSIGYSAFEGCTGLTSIDIPDSVTSIGGGAFEGCTGLTSIDIPDSVTSIGDSAFYGCTGLTSVTIPDSVTWIGVFAFSDCTGLTSVTIPDSVTSINSSAFEDCTGLTSVTIPDSVTSIGEDAFYGCTGLTSVTIPDSVTSIGSAAFSGTGLTSIKVAEGNTVYDSRDNCNALIETESNELIYGCKNTVIPDSVTSIGYSAFEGCTGLTSIDIPDSVTSIGGGAFRGCTGLTSIDIPDSVTSISEDAFSGCTGLTSIKVAEGNTVYDSRNDCNAIIITESNELIYGCKNTVIPDSVTSIGSYAFSGCTGLTSIDIPDSVTSIGERAFEDCTELTSVTIPDSVTSIGYCAFNGCTGLTNITIPDSVTSIGNGAFYNTAWYDNQPEGLVYAGKVAYTMKGSCPSEVVIKYGTLGIAGSAFYGCKGLTSVTIPDSVTSIGSGAFAECTGLTSITIPDSVKSFGIYAVGHKRYFSGYIPIPGFTIYGYPGSEAERYAEDNGFSFIKLTEKTDDKTGIIASVPDEVELRVVNVLDQMPVGTIKAYDISLMKDGETVQPENVVTVKIPCESENLKVYRINANGTKIDMNAEYKDGYYVFYTDHFSVYVLAEPEPEVVSVPGDVTGDGKTNAQDCTAILRYVRKLDTLSDDQLKIGDVTGDGKVNVQDVTRILRHVRKIEALY